MHSTQWKLWQNKTSVQWEHRDLSQLRSVQDPDFLNPTGQPTFYSDLIHTACACLTLCTNAASPVMIKQGLSGSATNWLFKLRRCQAQVYLTWCQEAMSYPLLLVARRSTLAGYKLVREISPWGLPIQKKLQLFTKQISRSILCLCVYAYWICPSASINLPSATAFL